MNKEVDKLISNAPLISVITVVYNSVSTIEETIMSVINQTYSNIEYIVIDGGSTDGTVDIIKKYHEHISYWVSEPDKGIYDAMNKGIKVSTGEWGHFLNSGDVFIAVDAFKRMMDSYRVSKEYADVLYGDIVCKYDFGLFLSKPSSLRNFESFFPISHPATLVRIDILKRTLFDISFKISADFKMLRQLYFNKCKFLYFPIPMVLFDAVSGVSSTNNVQRYGEDLKILGKRQGFKSMVYLFILLAKTKFSVLIFKVIPVKVKHIYKKNRLLSNSRICKYLKSGI